MWTLRRPAARVVVLDPDGRIFLMQGSDPMRPEKGDWWEIPGGGMEPGESSEHTAMRELHEECGIDNAVVGPCVWTQFVEFDFAMYHFLSNERIHVAWTDTPQEWNPQALEALEAAAFEDGQWWTLEDLLASPVRTLPDRLREFLPALVAGEIPDEPIDISPPGGPTLDPR
jgi:8-oxo-dGTP pyrophosphatase MutT (NUDIX family)